MATDRARHSPLAGSSSFSIGRIAGIEILIHWSWLVIFFLLTWSLAEGLYLHDYPRWTTTQGWLAGALTSLVLFSCVLIHELSHSILARSQGINVSSITLFIFGGVSSLTEEPKRPGQEFAIAAIGPAVSLALAGCFALAAALVSGPVGRATTYLAFINVALGVFNLLPGFPLDGGRVLRSFIWARSRNLLKATRLASMSGKLLGGFLIGAGLLLFFAGSGFGGLWFAVIGWFLYNQAGMSYQEVVARDVLSRIHAGSLLSRDFHSVQPDVALASFAADYLLTYHERCFPVISNRQLFGLISLADLKKFPREDWPNRAVQEAMTPAGALLTVTPSDDLAKATQLLASADVHQLPVMEDGEFVGFVTRAAVVQALRSEDELEIIRVGSSSPDASAIDSHTPKVDTAKSNSANRRISN
ncbi:MAG TPA: site-2 protease family protein [Dehalococcoidia bacterium]|nr:site-2 protease family protein [Dehalococcoidia bacterium]